MVLAGVGGGGNEWPFQPFTQSARRANLWNEDPILEGADVDPLGLSASGENGPQLVIADGGDVMTTIRSASDLLVWLVGHPIPSAQTPAQFAQPATLRKVLVRLKGTGDRVEPAAVWSTVVAVAAEEKQARAKADSDEDSQFSSEDDSGDSAHPVAENPDDGEKARGGQASQDDEKVEWDEVPGLPIAANTGPDPTDPEAWPEGQWGTNQFGEVVPLEFKRRISDEALTARKQEQLASLKGYRLVGFHGTTIECVGSLLAYGPAGERIGSGNGIGKGHGFYVAPVLAPPGVPAQGTSAAKKDARTWGSSLIAVYVGTDVEIIKGGRPANAPAMSYWGADELVIPVELFAKTKLVRNPDDCAVLSDPRYPAEPYAKDDDPVSMHNKATQKIKK